MSAPDARGWAAIGLFAVFFVILFLVAWNPELAKLDVIKLALGGSLNSGVLLVASFYFGSSKKDPEPK